MRTTFVSWRLFWPGLGPRMPRPSAHCGSATTRCRFPRSWRAARNNTLAVRTGRLVQTHGRQRRQTGWGRSQSRPAEGPFAVLHARRLCSRPAAQLGLTRCNSATGVPDRVIVIRSPLNTRSSTSPPWFRDSRTVASSTPPVYWAGALPHNLQVGEWQPSRCHFYANAAQVQHAAPGAALFAFSAPFAGQHPTQMATRRCPRDVAEVLWHGYPVRPNARAAP